MQAGGVYAAYQYITTSDGDAAEVHGSAVQTGHAACCGVAEAERRDVSRVLNTNTAV